MTDLDKTYSVYVLFSLKHQDHYHGLSSNAKERIKQHNAGKVRSTKSRRPFILIYEEEVGTLTEARKREKYLKSAAGRRFLKKIMKQSKVSPARHTSLNFAGGGSPPD